MSLRCKRAKEDSDFTLRDSPLNKRHRGARFQAEGHAQLVSPSVLTDLLSLFPTMDPQAVITVLSDCNNDIDAAIKRLGDMRLREESTSGLQQQPEEASCSAAGTQQERRPSVDGMPQTSGEWVEKLVQEMSASRDVEEARGRGHRFLTAFEAFVNQDKTSLLGKIQDLQKENSILKRAVQIQNTKLQERTHLDSEVQHLRLSLGQCQEQVRTLEMNNYSLALHLQQATNGGGVEHRPPDVF